MIKDFTNRRELKFQEHFNSKKFAERVAFIMPHETYDEINQKALNNDPDALLTLGDVFMYGLMRQVPNKQKALFPIMSNIYYYHFSIIVIIITIMMKLYLTF